VILTAADDGGWDCLQWGTRTPPFLPVPDTTPVQDAAESGPMG
jgi:hypothetical protein